MDDRTEPGVTEEPANFAEGYRIVHFDTEALQQIGIHVDAFNAKLDRPIGSLLPVRSDECGGAGRRRGGGDRLEQPTHLTPTLPIVTDIRDAVSLSTARPMLRRFGGSAKWTHDSTGVIAVEQK